MTNFLMAGLKSLGYDETCKALEKESDQKLQ